MVVMGGGGGGGGVGDVYKFWMIMDFSPVITNSSKHFLVM